MAQYCLPCKLKSLGCVCVYPFSWLGNASCISPLSCLCLQMLLVSLMRSRLLTKESSEGSPSGSRLITSRHGLWFSLLPRVVQLINQGQPVHVSRLVDDAWLAQLTVLDGKADAPFDILCVSFSAANSILHDPLIPFTTHAAKQLLRHLDRRLHSHSPH